MWIVTILAAIYAYTYARWLNKTGNRVGAIGVFLIVMAGLALAVYRQVSHF